MSNTVTSLSAQGSSVIGGQTNYWWSKRGHQHRFSSISQRFCGYDHGYLGFDSNFVVGLQINHNIYFFRFIKDFLWLAWQVLVWSVCNQLETGSLQYSLWLVATALQVQFNIEIVFGQANKIKIKHDRSDLKLLSFKLNAVVHDETSKWKQFKI